MFSTSYNDLKPTDRDLETMYDVSKSQRDDTSDDLRHQQGKYGLGAEDFGPPAPTSTQVAIQTTRDVLTSQIPFTATTFYIMVGGVIAAYMGYQYFYPQKAS